MREIEEWRDIEGYEGLYLVSSLGRVKSMDRWVTYSNGVEHLHKGKIIKPSKVRGYLRVMLYKDGYKQWSSVHRLVSNAFIPNPDNLETVNHIDENRSNNRVDNLEWMSPKQNTRYSQSKPINQFTLDGKFIRTWECIREVQYQLGYNQSFISKCCRGIYKTAYGFLWRYAD